MSLPFRSVRARLAPDDVLPAELATELQATTADAAAHFTREHHTKGAQKGKHDAPPIFAAVARFDFSAFTTYSPLGGPQSGQGTLLWADGFEVAPHLVVGTCPLFTSPMVDDGIFLQWRIADRRADDTGNSKQLVCFTPVWSGSGLPEKYPHRTEGRDGAIWLASKYVDPATERPATPPGLVQLQGLTIGINLLAWRR